MDRQVSRSKLYYRVCCCVLFFVAAAASFNGYYDKWHFREPSVAGASSAPGVSLNQYGFAEIIDGTAARPFIYRQLLPMLANGIDRVTPQHIKDYLFNGRDGRRLPDILFDSPLAKDRTYFYRYLVFYIASFLFVWLAVYAMYLVCQALAMPPMVSVFAPVIMILLMPYFLTGGGYFYDYPELAFLALTMWMALKFDWWWMVPLVALATWNKESFLLVTLTLYPILRRRTSWVSALIGTGCMALTCAAVYWVIRSHYAQNPGETVLKLWEVQLSFFTHPLNFVEREKTYGVLNFRAFTVLPLALIVWTAVRGWNRLPKAIQRHAQVAAAINLPLYILFCAPGEIRDFSLLYMVFMLLLAVNLSQAFALNSEAVSVK